MHTTVQNIYQRESFGLSGSTGTLTTISQSSIQEKLVVLYSTFKIQGNEHWIEVRVEIQLIL